ncbi:hypothetical protein [Pseudoalteromonas sp. SR41-4]|uniref:hypothetical protein n=1 Tax=Pseudoalteromonas sp. SR41-4 TaxID=2760950 RepID=UPI001604036F|nr:hypothetical protein [Pseudoalteromonas sp. SR41-4]MBB1292173.1 hypothetical protein [Pseudoalteromonas sp. SR41-4]
MTKEITTLSNDEQKAIVDAQDILTSKQDVLMELGRLQAFAHIKNYATVAEITIFKRIRESKEYKGLTYKKDGKTATVATIDEFCSEFLNRSYRSLKEAEDYLAAFGESFYETSKQIGIGNREMRALRQLPEEEQALIIESEAVEVGDKEAIRDLIADLKAQHKKELDTEKKKAKEIDDQRQVAVRMRDEYQMKAMDYQTELESTKFKADAWVDQTKHLLFEATKYESNAVESLSRLIALREHFLDDDNLSPQVTEYLAAGLLHSFKTLAEDFAQAWLETSNILEGYLPKMRPSLDVLQELNDSAMSNEE